MPYPHRYDYELKNGDTGETTSEDNVQTTTVLAIVKNLLPGSTVTITRK